ncbi:hypothetical protein O9993_12050 [Vibrio lentus]|nr:hypothetical protein [Vibrio lentus]
MKTNSPMSERDVAIGEMPNNDIVFGSCGADNLTMNELPRLLACANQKLNSTLGWLENDLR